MWSVLSYVIRVKPSTEIYVERSPNCWRTSVFTRARTHTHSLTCSCATTASGVSFILLLILVLIVSCCRFFSFTVEHSAVGCTSTFISGQAIRFTVSKCWISTASCNYMVARWTTIRENYRNGKLFFFFWNEKQNRIQLLKYDLVFCCLCSSLLFRLSSFISESEGDFRKLIESNWMETFNCKRWLFRIVCISQRCHLFCD